MRKWKKTSAVRKAQEAQRKAREDHPLQGLDLEDKSHVIFEIIYYSERNGKITKLHREDRCFLIHREAVEAGLYRKTFTTAFFALGLNYQCIDFENWLAVSIPPNYNDDEINNIPQVRIKGTKKNTSIGYAFECYILQKEGNYGKETTSIYN